MFPAGLGSQKPRFANQQRLAGRNQVPTMNRRGLFYVESPYPFLLYVKFTNPAPCLKHTHLKRCLYYNHLPQPISAAHRKRKILQKKPLRNPFFWSSESNQTQDPNADDYDKYSPLAEEWGDCNDQDKIDAATCSKPTKIEAEAAVAEKKIVKSFVSLVRPALLACWESWVVQTHCYTKAKKLSNRISRKRAKAGQNLDTRATSSSIPKHLIGQDKTRLIYTYVTIHRCIDLGYANIKPIPAKKARLLQYE